MDNLTHILEVDEQHLTLRAEPGVTIGHITNYLLHKGYALQVHVELESATLGGVAMGYGMDTSCHLHGLFQECIVAYELVTSTGEVIIVDEASDKELFHALPWSCGSVGFLVSVTVRICQVIPITVPCRRYCQDDP